MGRLLTLLPAVALTVGSALSFADTQVKAMGEFGVTTEGRYESYLHGGLGKLRFGTGEAGAHLFVGYLQVEHDFGEHWDGVVAMDVNDQLDQTVGFTEAVLRYRPLPWAGMRFRGKLGLFRPPISFEHGAEGWATRYTVQASALNSWVGEELGAYGFEASLRNDRATSNAPFDWGLRGAVFYGNDPIGTLLAWRGWSPNDVQLRPGDQVPFANLPFFQVVRTQAPRAEPYLEIDHRAGYYVGGEVGQPNQVMLRLMRYDNRGNPESNAHGQYGWRTFFNAAGFQAALPFGFGLIGQYLWGRTYMGPIIGAERGVDLDFDAKFVLLTRVLGDHRVTVRREWFASDDKDGRAFDPNGESMRGWTLSYQRRLTDQWAVALEWLEVRGKRDARILIGENPRGREDALYATVRWTR